MSAIAAIPRRARFRAVTYLSTRPALYYGMRRITGRFDGQCVRPETEIVIEGFPRSANSTTVHRFLERQPGPVRIAHHKHHAAQLQRATAWGLPAVVLIREPRAACISLLALAAEAQERSGRPTSGGLGIGDVLSAYVAFYEAVEPHLKHLVIGRFDALRDEITDLVHSVNAQFGTRFNAAPGAASPQRELGWHAMPTPIRDRLKAEIRARVEADLAGSSGLRALMARAQAVHERYCEANERAG